MKKIIRFFMLLLLGLFLRTLCPFEAEAAVYQSIPLEKTKIGTRYFCSDINDDIYVYTGKTSKKTKVTTKTVYGGVTNGSYVYYANGSWNSTKKNVYRYQLSTKKRKLICRLPMKELIGVYGSQLFFVKEDKDTKRWSTYSYHMSTKKTRLILKDVDAKAYGAYVFGRINYGSGAKDLKIYNASSKKRIVISKSALAYQRIGDYIYYADAVKKTNTEYEVRVARYHMKTGKSRYIGDETIYCTKVYHLTADTISYRKYSGIYDYKKYR